MNRTLHTNDVVARIKEEVAKINEDGSLPAGVQALCGALVLTASLVIVRAYLPGVGGGLGLAAFVSVALLTVLRRVAA